MTQLLNKETLAVSEQELEIIEESTSLLGAFVRLEEVRTNQYGRVFSRVVEGTVIHEPRTDHDLEAYHVQEAMHGVTAVVLQRDVTTIELQNPVPSQPTLF